MDDGAWQRFENDTDDHPAVAADIGLGGIFVMLSLNQSSAMPLPAAVRVVLCDALRERDGTPTAVRASLVGRRAARSAHQRGWRRGSDASDAGTTITRATLRWGFERFVNRPSAQAEQSARAPPPPHRVTPDDVGVPPRPLARARHGAERAEPDAGGGTVRRGRGRLARGRQRL